MCANETCLHKDLLIEKLDSLKSSIDIHKNDMKVCLDEHKTEIKDIKKILNGNGQPGLVAKVQRHDKYIEEMNSSKKALINVIYRTVIAIMIGGLYKLVLDIINRGI